MDDVNRWHASGGHETWDEWHISGPTRRVVLSHAIQRLKSEGYMFLEDTKKHYIWHIKWVDGKPVVDGSCP